MMSMSATNVYPVQFNSALKGSDTLFGLAAVDPNLTKYDGGLPYVRSLLWLANFHIVPRPLLPSSFTLC